MQTARDSSFIVRFFVNLMKRSTLFLPLCLLTLNACKSKPVATMTSSFAATFQPDVMIGSYYKTKAMSSFYDEQPDSLITKTPTHFYSTSQVVQLMDANAGGGWARVRTEKDELGFMQFSNLKIVPFEKQPSAPKKRKHRDPSAWDGNRL
jgi:hypothetical protein